MAERQTRKAIPHSRHQRGIDADLQDGETILLDEEEVEFEFQENEQTAKLLRFTLTQNLIVSLIFNLNW